MCQVPGEIEPRVYKVLTPWSSNLEGAWPTRDILGHWSTANWKQLLYWILKAPKSCLDSPQKIVVSVATLIKIYSFLDPKNTGKQLNLGCKSEFTESKRYVSIHVPFFQSIYLILKAKLFHLYHTEFLKGVQYIQNSWKTIYEFRVGHKSEQKMLYGWLWLYEIFWGW